MHADCILCHESIFTSEPILADFDFRFAREIVAPERVYDSEFVKEEIGCFWTSIEKYVDTTGIDYATECYVTEKPDAVYDEENEFWKDGHHFMFPHIITEPILQYIIREDVMRAIAATVEKMHLVNDVTDVVDAQVIYKNGWMMYGSHKKGKTAYKMIGEDDDGTFVSGVYIAHRFKKKCSALHGRQVLKTVRDWTANPNACALVVYSSL